MSGVDLSRPLDATAVIITFNEEQHIARCIEQIRPYVRRVVIADSFSTDRTCEIAAELGAEVLTHTFVNHAAQFNWAMKAADITTAWTIRLDADEYFDAAGLRALYRAVEGAAPGDSAFAFRRGVVFQGRRLRFGGIGNVYLTRVWRSGVAEVEARWMDEHVLVHQGTTRRIPQGAIVDENLNDITWWTDKHNGYTTRQMVQSMLTELDRADRIDLYQLNTQVRRKRILRERLYSPSPLYWRAIAYFLYRYIFAFGFLDGRAGLLFHFFQGLWNFFLVDVKIAEARRAVARGGYPAFEAWVDKVYGIDLARAN